MLTLFVSAALVSCQRDALRSPGVTITAVNDSAKSVNTIEIDYPGGSYGIGSLPPGGSSVRWIKVTGSAALRIDFIDAGGEHQAKPLALQPGDSGSIVLHIQNDGRVSVEDHRKR